MDELKLTDSEVKQVLGNQELKEIIMPFGIVTKRNSVDFVCCNCREEIRINENIRVLIVLTAMLFLGRMKMEVI